MLERAPKVRCSTQTMRTPKGRRELLEISGTLLRYRNSEYTESKRVLGTLAQVEAHWLNPCSALVVRREHL